MCDFEPDGYADVWRASFHRAGKTHRCCSCRAAIPKGEPYCSLFTVFEGNAETAKTCWLCWTALVVFQDAHRAAPYPAEIGEALDECVEQRDDGWEAWRALRQQLSDRRASAKKARP